VIGIQGTGNSVPDGFLLEQNYPNPFNPATDLKYTIALNSHVKLTIYDTDGREIAAIVNSNQGAGKYSIQWDASNYPSGVYYYVLTAVSEAGTFSESKKMVLIK
jgi:flagellar hook assembly protein FlgD